jgi:hypothetical protein
MPKNVTRRKGHSNKKRLPSLLDVDMMVTYVTNDTENDRITIKLILGKLSEQQGGEVATCFDDHISSPAPTQILDAISRDLDAPASLATFAASIGTNTRIDMTHVDITQPDGQGNRYINFTSADVLPIYGNVLNTHGTIHSMHRVRSPRTLATRPREQVGFTRTGSRETYIRGRTHSRAQAAQGVSANNDQGIGIRWLLCAKGDCQKNKTDYTMNNVSYYMRYETIASRNARRVEPLNMLLRNICIGIGNYFISKIDIINDIRIDPALKSQLIAMLIRKCRNGNKSNKTEKKADSPKFPKLEESVMAAHVPIIDKTVRRSQRERRSRQGKE